MLGVELGKKLVWYVVVARHGGKGVEVEVV